MSTATFYSTAAEAWHAMLKAKLSAGVSRDQALGDLIRERPTLHTATLVEANYGRLKFSGKSPEEQAIMQHSHEVQTLRASGMTEQAARDAVRREQPKLAAAYRKALELASR